MFDSKDLSYMRDAQVSHMPDVCHRLIHSSTADSHNQQIKSFTEDNTDIPCGLDMRPGSENRRDRLTELRWDATIRLPIDTEIDPRDRLKIVSRFSEPLTPPLIFSIVGPIQRGPSGIRLRLEKVEPGGPT